VTQLREQFRKAALTVAELSKEQLNLGNQNRELTGLCKKMHRGYFKSKEPKKQLHLQYIEEVPTLCRKSSRR
jgi:hypothetical protein